MSAHPTYANPIGGSGAPPPYHAVVSQGMSEEVKSEKPMLDPSPNPAAAVPAVTRRRGLWRRIWDRLRGSGPASSQHLPPLPHQPAKGSNYPRPRGEELPDERWAQPRTSCSIQRGPPRHARRCKYGLFSQHCPVDRVTPDDVASAPWIAELLLGADDLDQLLRADLPWTENLHRCWFDKMAAKDHPLFPDQRLYARRIKLGCLRADGKGADWVAHFAIWHRDAQWLADLPYSQLGAMFRPDTLFW